MQSRFELIDIRLGLSLPYIANNLPLSAFIMSGQFNGVPNEMMEAARIDGAGQWQTFSRVMLPIVKPGIATVIIMTLSQCGESLHTPEPCAPRQNPRPLL